eukprot:752492-Hanusia_phi.AAC.3
MPGEKEQRESASPEQEYHAEDSDGQQLARFLPLDRREAEHGYQQADHEDIMSDNVEKKGQTTPSL